jgi:2-hydroxychromene-2-carboxylate isomerase
MTDPRPGAVTPLEFWFEFGSTYSYLATMRIEALAQRHGVPLMWKPFLLGPIFQSLGWDTSPLVLQKEKGAYTWRDMERQCAKYGLPWRRPSVFPRRALLPMRVAVAAAHEPWMGDYCRGIMQLAFAQDRDIDTRDAVAEVLEALGVPVERWLAAAQAQDNKGLLREQTEQARARGVFGAPTFFVGAEMFWGNDRLEDTMLLAAQGPSSSRPAR